MTRFTELAGTTSELTEVAADAESSERIRRLTDYITADGFSLDALVTRMERLKFESIVQEKAIGEILADGGVP